MHLILQQVINTLQAATEVPESSEFQIPEDGCVTFSLPRISVATFRSTFGKRIVYWPTGRSDLLRVSMMSSRLGKRKDLKTWWFDAFRTALVRCDFENDCLCVVDGTAPAELVTRGSEIFALPRLRIRVSDSPTVDADGLVDWVRLVQKQHSADRAEMADLETEVWISPEVLGFGEAAVTMLEVPLADQLLAHLGDKLVVLSCRKKGNVERAVMDRLSHTTPPAAIVLLAMQDELSVPSEKLVHAGAIPWILDSGPTDPNAVFEAIDSEAGIASDIRLKDGPLDQPDEWLCHWTRAAFGPWQDQPSADFLDELILGCNSADRSALAALMRIIAQQRILATVATAAEPPTVSFTAVPLHEFRQRRIFRKHKQRFDFEPWGVAIRKHVLVEQGCQKVHYVDDSANNRLAETGTAPMFTQSRFDQRKKIDWSQEKEWRLPGTLNLGNMASTDLCYFVSSDLDAKRLHHQCKSSVVVVPESGAES